MIEPAIGAAVIASAALGDEAAFARLVAAFDDDMARVAYLVIGDVELAHEAVQAAWTKAWHKLPVLRDRRLVRPWLVSIAANEARQLLRARRRRTVREIRMEGFEEVVGSNASDPGTRAANLDLQRALLRLEPDNRAIVAMRYALGLTSFEIAIVTGRSAPGVRSRLARALARLREELTDV